MSKGGNSPGLSKLARVFREMAKGQIPTDPLLDFGTIQGDKSLLTDSFDIPIPRSDYLILEQLKSTTAPTSETAVGDHGKHTHTVKINDGLTTGDRVLVAWINNDAVVIGKIREASEII